MVEEAAPERDVKYPTSLLKSPTLRDEVAVRDQASLAVPVRLPVIPPENVMLVEVAPRGNGYA